MRTEKEKNIKSIFLFHTFNWHDKCNIWISNLVSYEAWSRIAIINKNNLVLKSSKCCSNIHLQPEQFNIVLAIITITCCSPDRNNCKIYNTVSFPSYEQALHVNLHKETYNLQTSWTKHLIYLRNYWSIFYIYSQLM